jgi:hypothetical protein
MLRACGRASCGEFPRGARITYLTEANRTGCPFCEQGVLAAYPVYDPLTAQAWLPVWPLPAGGASVLLWVLCCNVVDIVDSEMGNDDQG